MDSRGKDSSGPPSRGSGSGSYNNTSRERSGGANRRSPSPPPTGDRRRASPSPQHPGGGRRGRSGRSRSYTPPPDGGGRRRSSRSWSRSRSRSPRSGRFHRDHARDYRDQYREYDRLPPYRDAGPFYRDDPGGRGDYNRFPPPDHPGRRRGGFDRREMGGPPPPPPPPFHRGGPDNGYPMPGARADRRGGDPGRRGGPEGLPGVSLLVRNIAPDITSADLKSAFGRIGVIRDVYVPLDYHSQQPRGFAFIEYATPEMAREAKLEMNRFVIKGHELEVVFAQERRKTPGEMRGRSIDAPDGAPASNRGGDRGRGGFERSSSFERHRQRERDDHYGNDSETKRLGKDDENEAPPL